MSCAVYFDAGTTNSRAYLIDQDGALIDSRRISVGSKDVAIAGSNDCLIEALYGLYCSLLKENMLSDADIEAVYASGMATSLYGIAEIPHLQLPVSLDAFAGKLAVHYEEKCFRRDIYLIPGLKTFNADISFVNNVRGEEIEVLGAMERIEAEFGSEPVAVVLPGSHTHTIAVRNHVFSDLLSNFTGELYSAISRETILAPVLNAHIEKYDTDMIRLGVRNLKEFGFTRALYICHAMRVMNYKDEWVRASYGEGVILGGLSQAIDQKCKTVWNDIRHFVILADAKMAGVYQTILEECETELEIKTITMDGDWIPSLEGMRRILRARKENAYEV